MRIRLAGAGACEYDGTFCHVSVFEYGAQASLAEFGWTGSNADASAIYCCSIFNFVCIIDKHVIIIIATFHVLILFKSSSRIWMISSPILKNKHNPGRDLAPTKFYLHSRGLGDTAPRSRPNNPQTSYRTP
jgi:hypothetical protein